MARRKRQCPVVPPEVQGAFQHAKRELVGAKGDLDSFCLEASAIMMIELPGAVAIRRELPEDAGGHWTVEWDGDEYDPTIGWWKKDRPKDVTPGCLYVLDESSAHHDWEITETSMDPAVRRTILDIADPKKH